MRYFGCCCCCEYVEMSCCYFLSGAAHPQAVICPSYQFSFSFLATKIHINAQNKKHPPSARMKQLARLAVGSSLGCFHLQGKLDCRSNSHSKIGGTHSLFDTGVQFAEQARIPQHYYGIYGVTLLCSCTMPYDTSERAAVCHEVAKDLCD